MERFLGGANRVLVQLSHLHCDSPCAAKESANLGEGEHAVGGYLVRMDGSEVKYHKDWCCV